MLGCNYWGSKKAIDMWADWDGASVERDLAELSKYGVKYLRVFPNWRDFQPIHAIYRWRGYFGEYRLHGKDKLTDEFGLDENCLSHFEEFLSYADKYGIKLIVAIVTGWMSGRLFVPPALEGKNHITDHESLRFQTLFVRGFVRRFKNAPQICAWDLGNECNCLGEARNSSDAFMWTSTIRNAILCEDNSRIIMSGMHGLSADPNHTWSIQLQGQLTDMLTPHPYPSPSVGGDVAPMNMLRTTLVPTFQCEYYSGIGQKPAMIQESGTFSNMIGNEECAADFMRVCIYSGWANGVKGYLWWCAHEQSMFDHPPYCWSMVERELGLLRADYSPKPVALTMKKAHDVISEIDLPAKKVDAVCITTNGENSMNDQLVSYVLAKQAGIDMSFAHCEQDLPDSKLYFVPCIQGWECMSKQAYEGIKSRVKEGATAYFSIKTGELTGFEEFFGLSSFGRGVNGKQRPVDFFGDKLDIRQEREFLLKPLSAEVLATDEKGNVILARNKYGKGWIYLLNFPMERFLRDSYGILNAGKAKPYYKIYAKIAEEVIKEKLFISNEPDIGVTLHPINDGECYAVAINYMNEARKCDFKVADGVKVETVYGSDTEISGCDMSIFKLTY